MATCLNYNDDRLPSPTSSTTSSSSTKYDWELLESNINSTEIATYIKCNIPRTQSYQNNYNVKCYNDRCSSRGGFSYSQSMAISYYSHVLVPRLKKH